MRTLLSILLCVASFNIAHAETWQWETYTNPNYVNHICVENDTLWWSTTGGVVQFNTQMDTVVRIYHREDGLSGNYVTCSVIDPYGNHWFGTRDHYMTRLTPQGEWTVYDEFDGIRTNAQINCATIIGDTLWIGTSQGVGVLDVRRPQNGFLWLDTNDGLVNNNVQVIQKFKGDLWFGTRGGISIWHHFQEWTNYTPEYFARADGADCRGLVQDWEGGVVSASKRGLYRLAPQEEEWDLIGNLNNRQLLTIAVYDSSIWTSSYVSSSSAHLYRVYFDGSRWQSETVETGLNGLGRSLAFAVDSQNRLWTSDWGAGVAVLENGNTWRDFSAPGIVGNHVRKVDRAPNGDLWLAVESDYGANSEPIEYKQQEGGAARFSIELNQWVNYTRADGLLMNTVKSMCVTQDGRAWFSQWPYGFMELDDQGTVDKEDDTWSQVRRPTIHSEVVYRLFRDPAGFSWVGTLFWESNNGIHQGGVEVENPETGEFTFWGHPQVISFDKNNIRDNVEIYDIHLADDGLYWLAGFGGISVIDTRGTLFDPTDDRTERWDAENEGLLALETYCVTTDAQGIVWIGGLGGLNRLDVNGTPFDKSDDNIQVIFELPVEELTIDPEGNLWCATRNYGVIRYNPATGEQLTIDSDRYPLSSDVVNSVSIEENGTERIVWFSTGLGLNKLTIDLTGSDPNPGDEVSEGPYPNPFQPSAGHTHLTFENLTNEGTLQIFDLSGDLVHEVNLEAEMAPSSTLWQWDGTNTRGADVASGVYIYRVDSPSGIRTGKFAIIR
ncbi:MAG: T9SS C-terminal target domain-containing protein [Gemmatimonadetes bacterium]|nr:MAG: T9SS C-terminal target domain-containing protein [Gemmatimonadota bacterium]